VRKLHTLWNYSLTTEADRLINTALFIGNGFFAGKKFLVLPYLPAGQTNTVYFPDWNWSFSFLTGAGKLTPKIPQTSEKKVLDYVKAKLKEHKINCQIKDCSTLQQAWRKTEKKFWICFNQLFPQIRLSALEIRPTHFGTSSSFQLEKGKITLYQRLDADVSTIAEGVVSAVSMKLFKKNSRTWHKNFDWERQEAFVDGILKFTRLSQLFPHYRGTIESLAKRDQGELVRKSRAYLSALGFGAKDALKTRDGRILIKEKDATRFFSASEARLLTTLIVHQNSLCTCDLLAEAVWGEDCYDRYSLWAIAKTVERARAKLQNLGINPAVIQAKRKGGYLLAE
jgi:hypothetical protein